MLEHFKNMNKKEKYNSMPPKTRIPKDEEEVSDSNSEANKNKSGSKGPRILKIDSEVEQEIKSKRRTASTGGSSMKEAEIIGEIHNNKKVGSPSPSPIGHHQYPMAKAPLLKHVLALNNPHITISDANSLNNTTTLITSQKSNNSKGEFPKKYTKISRKRADFSNLFKHTSKSKKRKSHKGISKVDFTSITPIGIGHLAPPPIAVGFGLPRGRHKKAVTAFDYENLNNSFQVNRLRHNTITATPSHRNRNKKRKGPKKIRVS